MGATARRSVPSAKMRESMIKLLLSFTLFKFLSDNVHVDFKKNKGAILRDINLTQLSYRKIFISNSMQGAIVTLKACSVSLGLVVT